MITKSEIWSKASALREAFAERGAKPVETDILLPAEVLLDLYGEDIRARAFVTDDPLRGETMLRPDFTVPVTQIHLASKSRTARYTYAGEVFRRQEDDETRPREYVQVGYESFGASDRAREDAEVFSAIENALVDVPVRAVTGDIGIISALIDDLDTSDGRKSALRRHIWRPRRFHALLDRYSAPTSRSLPEVLAPHVGLRSYQEIQARCEALLEDARTAPLPSEALDQMRDVLAVQGQLSTALNRLEVLARPGTHLQKAVHALEARLEALLDIGVDPTELWFEASYGRTNMEYYNGFVFGFSSDDEHMPAVATGGRFDMVPEVLGQPVPAVGGVIRPELILELSA